MTGYVISFMYQEQSERSRSKLRGYTLPMSSLILPMLYGFVVSRLSYSLLLTFYTQSTYLFICHIFKILFVAEEWWHTPLIPAHWKAQTGGSM